MNIVLYHKLYCILNCIILYYIISFIISYHHMPQQSLNGCSGHIIRFREEFELLFCKGKTLN